MIRGLVTLAALSTVLITKVKPRENLMSTVDMIIIQNILMLSRLFMMQLE